MSLNIKNETDQLVSVILGVADDMVQKQSLEDCIDPKTRENILNNTFPTQESCIDEIEKFCEVLTKYDVEVLRPNIIQNLNQIFTRDIGFVIDNKFFVPEIIEQRNTEKDGIKYFIDNLDSEEKIIVPNSIKVEGGDVIVHNEFLFIGYSNSNLKVSRTTSESIKYFQDQFPNKEVIGFEMIKDDTNPYESILHLDCAMQPVGRDKIIIYKEGFQNNDDIKKIKKIFGKQNLILIDRKEMYEGNSNIFSINEEIVVSDPTFTRLNNILKDHKIKTEKVYYREISKFGGLFRCSTLPIKRNQ